MGGFAQSTSESRMRIGLITVAIFAAGFVAQAAPGGHTDHNVINTVDDECKVQLTDGSKTASSDHPNIHFKWSRQEGRLRATCKMTDSAFELNREVFLVSGDYSMNKPQRCEIVYAGRSVHTTEFQIVATPSGNVTLVCTALVPEELVE